MIHPSRYIIILVAASVLLISSCSKEENLRYSESEWLAGGSQTVFDRGAGAFSHPFPNLSSDKLRVHEIGDLGFEASFVTAPAPLNPGLGPLYNNVSCFSCHISDGRGRPPYSGEVMKSMLIRLSGPGTDLQGGPLPLPGFGGQLQQFAIAGKVPEADVQIIHSYLNEYFADGSVQQLQVPEYQFLNPYQPFPAGMMYSPRVAPPVFGLGLLEAVADETILEYADPNDLNGDQISGKANYGYDVVEKKRRLGRFGWKAAQPTLKQQTAGAYHEDMGITSPYFASESASGQPQDDLLNDDTEISDSLLHAVTFYVQTLAVPARRNADEPNVIAGKNIFMNAGCASCHRPSMRTKVNVAFPEISNQLIFPYTDMLLHDMGEGLADNRPDYDANGKEWRTPPLWGIGLTRTINGHNNFLHDGRARSLMEAILWHGGEADSSKQYVKKLSEEDRNKLIDFLESL